MSSNELLDSLKKHLNLSSDYALSKALKVTPNSLKEMRARGLSDERTLQITLLLGMPRDNALAAMASIHAERAKDPEVKEAWDSIVRTLKRASAATVTGFFLLGALGGTTPNAQGSPQTPSSSGSMYIMSNRRRVSLWGRLARSFGTGFACPAPI